MDRKNEQVELFRAYTADEMQEKETALATSGFIRGYGSSNYLTKFD